LLFSRLNNEGHRKKDAFRLRKKRVSARTSLWSKMSPKQRNENEKNNGTRRLHRTELWRHLERSDRSSFSLSLSVFGPVYRKEDEERGRETSSVRMKRVVSFRLLSSRPYSKEKGEGLARTSINSIPPPSHVRARSGSSVDRRALADANTSSIVLVADGNLIGCRLRAPTPTISSGEGSVTVVAAVVAGKGGRSISLQNEYFEKRKRKTMARHTLQNHQNRRLHCWFDPSRCTELDRQVWTRRREGKKENKRAGGTINKRRGEEVSHEHFVANTTRQMKGRERQKKSSP